MNKPTLIIPAAGKSTRFPNMKPKWMLTHPSGKLMIEMVLLGILKDNVFSRIIITITKEHAEKYEAELILQQMLTYNNIKAEILVINHFTKSASETINITLLEKNINGSFVIKDSDNYIECKLPKGNFIIGSSLNNKKIEISNIPGKSFIVLDQNSKIVNDIIEKRIVSDIVSLGVYGIECSEKFKKSSDKLEKNSHGQEHTEIYISHVISYLIGVNDEIFYYGEVDKYEDWGTLDDWKKIQYRNRTFFIDIDGVIFKNSGKYGTVNWSNNDVVLEQNIKVIKNLADNGAQIFFVTARSKNDIKIVEKILKKENVNYESIITNCHHSSRILINDFANTNPYPSCSAINIPRNGNLEEYIKGN
ncbi:hypothetical protein [Aliarcobacter butzleri]|uniref:hypothetical protein n=1 Tax=Aliarcobacter butzleri TaxID=28197 RepID=UPI0021B41EE0|nr:hypothetical protein [Aliarcobacter butzleri]MCT7581817.1 hypothetical protein [Aliarcobacter butzleri]